MSPDVHSPQAIPRERFTSPIGGRYQLFDILGCGGQGTVFAAWDLGPEGANGPGAASRPDGSDLPRVAVKMYRPPENEQAAALVEREAAVHFRLKLHPNIVTPLDHGVETVQTSGFYGGAARMVDHPYLVTELADGSSLYHRMQDGSLSIAAIRRVVAEIGSAAHFAHRAGIIVRDLKPSNILGRREPGNAEEVNLLADFGIAKPLPSGLTTAHPHTRIGTPLYVSPEQARGEVLEPSSDVYSLGLILHELLAGAHPFSFAAGNLRDLAGAHQQLTVPLLDQVPTFAGRPEAERRIALALQEVTLQAVSKEPMDRQQTMKQLVWQFEQRYLEATGEPRVAVHDLKPTMPLPPPEVIGWTHPDLIALLPDHQVPGRREHVQFQPAAVEPPNEPLKAAQTVPAPEPEGIQPPTKGTGTRRRRTLLVGAGTAVVVAAGAGAVNLVNMAQRDHGTTHAGVSPSPDIGPTASNAQPASVTSPTPDPGKPVANTRDIPVGGGKIVAVGADHVVISRPSTNVAGFKYVPALVFSATCTHRGCTVASVAEGTINCVCHGSKFSAVDGSVRQGPATAPLRRIAARTDANGDIYLE